MHEHHSSFLIAGPKSNSGKTIITLGLLQALKNRGLSVQPFKCGPDYIDPMHHRAIAGTQSYNLDMWMSSKAHVTELFEKQRKHANVSLVEGVMGLFDGARKQEGSSAELAKLLHLPVVLVVDASSVAYSIAPLLYGFKHFDSELNICGVIFNKVAGEGHYKFLKDAADDVGIPSFGYVPRNSSLTLESRHLGLHMPQDGASIAPVTMAAELLEKHVDIDLILALSTVQSTSNSTMSHVSASPSKTIFAIARDEAFNFMYPANIDASEQLGTVVYFSPIHDAKLPVADVVWLPGGYPELYAQQLADNTSMQQSVRDFSESGGVLIAECGGMIYLGKYFSDADGNNYTMVGLFDFSTTLKEAKLSLGYRRVAYGNHQFAGHEFHYSRFNHCGPSNTQWQSKTARDTSVEMPVFTRKRTWASYLHLYLGEVHLMKAFLDTFNSQPSLQNNSKHE